MTPRSNRKTAAVMLAVAAIFVFAVTPARAVIPSDSVPTLAPLIKEVSPAVVNIATSGTVEIDRSPFFDDPFFRRFFGDRPHRPQQRQTQSVGSGVIINAAKGYVLTNSHVVAKADEIIKPPVGTETRESKFSRTQRGLSESTEPPLRRQFAFHFSAASSIGPDLDALAI